MIAKGIKDLCDTPELIENYDKAIASPEVWECHHRRQLEYTRKELIERGEYLHRPPEELIFLTQAEHNHLHLTVCKGWKERLAKLPRMKGTKRTAESLEKMSKAHKGKKHTAETIEKMSKSHKGRLKGTHHWNNGVISVSSKECPGPDFVRGFLK